MNRDKVQQLRNYNGKKQKFMFTEQVFQGKALNGLKLTYGQFYNCDFTGSGIGGGQFNECEFVRCNFTGVSFLGVKFNNCVINQCNFSDAILNDVMISDSIFTDNNLDTVNIKQGVCINGEDIVSNQQLTDVITDQVEQQQSNFVVQILQQLPFVQGQPHHSFVVTNGLAQLHIYQKSEHCWQFSVEYNGDIVLTTQMDLGDQDKYGVFLQKSQIGQIIIKTVTTLIDFCKKRFTHEFPKKQLQGIASMFEQNRSVIVAESIQSKNTLIKVLRQEVKSLTGKLVKQSKGMQFSYSTPYEAFVKNFTKCCDNHQIQYPEQQQFKEHIDTMWEQYGDDVTQWLVGQLDCEDLENQQSVKQSLLIYYGGMMKDQPSTDMTLTQLWNDLVIQGMEANAQSLFDADGPCDGNGQPLQ